MNDSSEWANTSKPEAAATAGGRVLVLFGSQMPRVGRSSLAINTEKAGKQSKESNSSTEATQLRHKLLPLIKRGQFKEKKPKEGLCFLETSENIPPGDSSFGLQLGVVKDSHASGLGAGPGGGRNGYQWPQRTGDRRAWEEVRRRTELLDFLKLKIIEWQKLRH